MFGRRRQTARLGTRVVRRAARTVGTALRKAKSYARPFKRAAGAAVVSAAVNPIYRRVRRTANRIAQGLSFDTPGNDLSVVRHKVGRKKKPNLMNLKRLLEAGLQKRVYRWQAISNYDTNVGQLFLANANVTTNPLNAVISPFHVYDITSFPNISTHRPAHMFGWTSTAIGADVYRANLNVNQENNGNSGNGFWTLETSGGDGVTNFPNARHMRHDWTDIRLNLYGPRKRTTRFDIMFVRIADDLANLVSGATTNSALKELVAYIERPSIYSNIQSHTTAQVAKKMKIVKRYTYYVPGAQSTDVDTAVGKIKEVRIFMRHDKVYSLDWKEDTQQIPHNQIDGLDFVQDTQHNNTPWVGSRVFMIVRAFAPERSTLATYYGDSVTGTAPTANIDPTYDIIIRNCVSLPA